MLNALKFVQGAVAKKDFVPSMTHFAIEDGNVRAFNGTIALSSPIALDFSCRPKASELVQALSNCTETVSLSLADGKLVVKSGAFRAYVECIGDETPHVKPEGDAFPIDGSAILDAFKVVAPFIGTDASRLWSNGVLLRESSALATNNVTLVEYWTASPVPTPVLVPLAAVKEMLRIDEPPASARLDKNSISFCYSNGRWIRAQLSGATWPDVSKMLDRQSDPKQIDDRIFEGLKRIEHFTDSAGRVHFRNGSVSTHEKDGTGACFEIPELAASGIFQIEMVERLNGVADTIDWSAYPNPVPFFGKRLRGIIVGMR